MILAVGGALSTKHNNSIVFICGLAVYKGQKHIASLHHVLRLIYYNSLSNKFHNRLKLTTQTIYPMQQNVIFHQGLYTILAVKL